MNTTLISLAILAFAIFLIWLFNSEKPQRKKIPQDIMLKVAERDGARCKSCGSTEDLQLDHKYPFSKINQNIGFGHDPNTLDNLQILCGKCNRRKSNKTSGLPY